MDDKTREALAGLVDMIRKFKGADFVEPTGDVAPLSLTDDFGLDSLDIINLLFQIDENFGVKVTAADLKERSLLVIGNMAAYIVEQS